MIQKIVIDMKNHLKAYFYKSEGFEKTPTPPHLLRGKISKGKRFQVQLSAA